MKKSLSILLAVILLLSTFPVISFAKTSQAEVAYDSNKGLLEALGAEISQMAQPENFITRGEFTKYVVQLFDMADSIVVEGNYFRDVRAGETNNAEYINAAAAMGLVGGNTSGYFLPEEKITYSEAYKIVCEALGYNVFAKSNGGYSQGYYPVVNTLGLNKGLAQTAGSVTYQDACMLLYNMLFSEVTEFDIGEMATGMSEENFLSYYRDIELVKGRITANDITGLYDKSATISNHVIIDGETYAIGGTSADELLGYEVEAYVNTEEEELVYVAKSGTDTVYEFSGTDIYDYSNNTIYYTADDKDIKVKLDGTAPVNYNMIYESNVANIDFNSYIDDAYTITVIKTRTGEQLVFIKNYEIIVVQTVNENLRTIYQKYSRPSVRFEDDAELDIKILFMEEQVSLGSIVEWNILEVMRVETASGDIRYYITIVDYPFKGYLKGRGADDNGTYYLIDGTKYYATDAFLTSGADIPAMGEKAVFYTDSMGRIVAIDCKAETNYAYLINRFEYDEEEGVGVTLFTAKGEHLKLKCAEKVKCNTDTKVTAEMVLELAPRQLVIYETNRKGELTEIYTAERIVPDTITEETPPAYDFDVFSLDYVTQVDSYVWRNYFRQGGRYTYTYGASDKTVFFDIPADLKDTRKYRAVGMSYFNTSGSVAPGAKIYDIDELGNASVVVIERKGATVAGVYNSGGKVMTGFVKDVKQVLNEDDELCYQFEFYGDVAPVLANAETLEYDTDTTFGYGPVDPERLVPGDLLNFAVDSYGNMLTWRIMFRATEPETMTPNYNVDATNMLQYGKVVASDGAYFSIDNGEMLVNLLYDQPLAAAYDVNGKYVWIYDSDREELITGSIGEVIKGDNLFIRLYNGIGQIIVLVR